MFATMILSFSSSSSPSSWAMSCYDCIMRLAAILIADSSISKRCTLCRQHPTPSLRSCSTTVATTRSVIPVLAHTFITVLSSFSPLGLSLKDESSVYPGPAGRMLPLLDALLLCRGRSPVTCGILIRCSLSLFSNGSCCRR